MMYSSILLIFLYSCKLSAVNGNNRGRLLLFSNNSHGTKLEDQERGPRFLLSSETEEDAATAAQDATQSFKENVNTENSNQKKQQEKKESATPTTVPQDKKDEPPNTEHPSQEEKNKDENIKKEENNNRIVTVVLPMLFLGFGICIILKRIMDRRRHYEGRWIVGSQDPDVFEDDGGYENDTSYNNRSFAGRRDHDAKKSRTWISTQDDWDWDDDSNGQDLEMGRMVSSPPPPPPPLPPPLPLNNGKRSSRDINTNISRSVSTSSSSNSQKTFPTSNSRKSTSSSVKRRNGSVSMTKSHAIIKDVNKEDYEVSHNHQVLTGKESHPRMVSVKANDSWDEDHSDLEDDDQDQDQQEEEEIEQDSEAADIKSFVPTQTHAMMATTSLPLPTSSIAAKKENNESSTITTTSSRTPTVEELLAEQFNNGQHPVITSFSTTKLNTSVVEKKQTPSKQLTHTD
mmetsp:Transcript_3052/g.5700  ORF Transcript_3052/g.5700 Transcript_3052/m.5700 type:complete len:457 (+) Transcript_3052:85-1455(+)